MSGQQSDVVETLSASDEMMESLPCSQPGVLTPEKLKEAEMASTGDEASECQMPGGTSGRTSPASSTGQISDVNVSNDEIMITDSMLAEEEKLKQNAEEDQKLQEFESGDSWKKELEEQRYKRLQHLLQKSSIYTNFLLTKMDEQQAKERKRQEKQAQKRKEEEKRQKKEREEKDDKEKLDTPKRSRRSGRKQDVDSSQESGSQEGAGKKISKGKTQNSETDLAKRGKKRKAETYSIADYLDKEVLTNTSKKQNVDCTDKEADTTIDAVGDETVKGSKSGFVDTFSREINGEKVSDLQPVLFSGGVLRKYQLDGMEWLKVLYENGVNGILGDEMGLGKTIQCIALFAYVIEMGVPGPFLVCAPLSTLPNWVSEFQRFTPKIPVLLYHGTKDERTKKRKQIRKKIGEHQSHPIVITSYEIVMNDRTHLQGLQWKYVIVDEGHRIKNLNCRLIKELKMYQTANRLLLTGTPLQNNLAELWSMLNFLLPEVFDDLNTFQSWFDFSTLSKEGGDEAIIAQEREQHVISMLHQILTPFLLRRLKADVDLMIPPKKELLVHAPLTKHQEEFYKYTLDKTIMDRIQERDEPTPTPIELTPSGRPKRRAKNVNYAIMMESGKKEKEKKSKQRINFEKEENEIIQWVEMIEKQLEKEEKVTKAKKAESSVVNIKLQNVMMQLRKCCNHPYLLEYPLIEATGEYRVDEELVTSCGKMMVVDRLLPALKERGHKVLIFSQMTTMMDILEDYCHLRSYQYCRLDGSTSIEDRQARMKEFNTDPDVFLFLLSTRAGGLGINLTAADTVIIYDSDWNPQSDLQAQDRCHRIGQTKPVIIYRLVTANTIDQKVVERAAAKRKLEKMVIHQGKFKGGKSNLAKDHKALINPKELLDLLRSSDHSGEVKNDKGISDSDLQLLLDRSDLIAQQNRRNGKQVEESKVKEFPEWLKVIQGTEEMEMEA
ncbi:lymphoid-specific helicase-like isoform X1 [Lytechinus variegatus]|uniref:lymphoid-specific helicase-like isoform X1 n=2 Tax=Lytechinus variegatus TaxID=7654 RepID=UPI001BB154BE|nr:lymphoid-specific helicase-like isoform X1 [Lytechinus variegatus]XP_041482496.1 lymphoid-specific helicase-like isoform X1 [Lytechinus variegatus]XP_041482497.1 lymphoid-specific helicase-like isoform X1 [Lytechinus variegatus]